MVTAGNKLYILGASTLGEIAKSIALKAGWDVLGFFDDINLDHEFCGSKIFGGIQSCCAQEQYLPHKIFVAIGDNQNRKIIADRLMDSGHQLVNIVDPMAHIEPSALIQGFNNLVMPGAYIGVGCVLGGGNLIFPGVSLTHHNKIGDFNFFGPNCSIGGHSTIGDGCKFGMNSVVYPYLEIPSSTSILPLKAFE